VPAAQKSLVRRSDFPYARIKFCMVRKRLLEAVAKDHLSDFKKNFKGKARFLVDESVGMATAGLNSGSRLECSLCG